ncbi:MAG: hypothetical protein L3J71_12675 [Victivallaceae bacterium]|nr:hypothetical protein [Victivallaceae bacterium]
MYLFVRLVLLAVIMSGSVVLANPPKSLGVNEAMLNALRPLKLKIVERPGKRAPNFKTIEAACLGKNRLLLKLTMTRPVPSNGGVVVYLNLDNDLKTGRKGKHHAGVDLMGMFGKGKMSKRIIGYKNTTAIGAMDKDILWMLIDAPLSIKDNQATITLHLLSQEKGKKGHSTKPAVFTIPITNIKPVAVKKK